MNSETMQALNAIQQVLRGLTVSMAAAARVPMPELASLLQAFAANEALEPLARRMLLDLAEGLDVLGMPSRQQ